jgi:Rieske 2Fe-2S family protein
MNTLSPSLDPRYALFQKLVDQAKNKQQPAPFKMTELDTRLYTDEAWFQREMKHIFQDVPLIIGFSCMLPQPGDHFTFDHAGKPMLLVRAKDGKIRCFLNVCRHRGVRLANSPEVSKGRAFTCRYHHWTYDLTGKLIFVPTEESFPGLDKSCRGLKELPVEEEHGFIWVNPRAEGEIDLPGFLGNIASDLDHFGLAGSYFFKQSVHEIKANWKLLIEAFQDGYHVTRLHNKSVGGFFIDNVAIQERVNSHIRSIVARKEFEECLQLPPEKWKFRHHSSFSHFIWPNTITIMHPDYSSQLSLFPLAVDRTIAIHNCVIGREPQSEKELGHFERGFKIIDDGVFAAEDFFVCEQAQLGMNSGANDSFLLGGHESGLRVFHQILQEVIGEYSKSESM